VIPQIKPQPPKELALHSLPFVGGRSPDGLGKSFWDIPSTGGFQGGKCTGQALAHFYLLHLRHYGTTDGGLLHLIGLHMLGTGVKSLSVRGQATGFFDVLDAWLRAAAESQLGAELDSIDPAVLLADATAGLNEGTHQPQMQLSAAARSES
jgi:hypothetical protein